MAGWNSKSSTQYMSLASGSTLTVANLETQTLTAAGGGTLDITSNAVCWSGSTTCTSGNTEFGFMIALPGTQEQIVFNPLIYQNALIVNTTIPAVNSPSSCSVAHDTGNTIAISLITGGALGLFKNTTDTNAAGSLTNGTGTPFIAQAGGNTFILTQSLGDASYTVASGAAPAAGPLTCTAGANLCTGSIQSAAQASKRLTWIQRR
jgi:type IV pilus assembly protein PilY1